MQQQKITGRPSYWLAGLVARTSKATAELAKVNLLDFDTDTLSAHHSLVLLKPRQRVISHSP